MNTTMRVLALSLVGVAAPVHAQSSAADSILFRHAARVGGIAWDTVRSRVSHGRIELGVPGVVGTFALTETSDRRLLIIRLPNGGEVREWFDGRRGWVQGPQGEIREEPAATSPSARRERQLARDPRVVGYRTVEILEGAASLLVVGRGDEGAIDTLAFDRESGLLLHRQTGFSTPNGPVRVMFSYADYRTHGPWRVPFLIRQERSDRTVVMRVDSIRINVVIDSTLFAPRR